MDHLKSLGLSAHAAREALRSGKVWVDGFPTADAGREVEPRRITYEPDAPRVRMGLDPFVVHVDPQLVVIWKPSGLLSVAAPGRRDERTAVGWVSHRLGQGLAVHRLDEGTSGLLLVARDPATRDRLKADFAEHRVERRYLAFVAGQYPTGTRVVRSTLVRDRGDGKRGSAPGGEEAVTELAGRGPVGPAASLVEARLETGRTHQVRIHLAEGGHPVLGDPLYGPRGSARACPRLALHAYVLGFRHPSGGRPLRFEAPLADDLEAWRREALARATPAS